MAPQASILIPNFNNGRESAIDGQTDLLGDLLSSLDATLADERANFEVLIGDDGSTDDSLATAQAFVERAQQAGRAARILEAPHCGVLSVVLNRLMHEAQGDIVCRLDGDVRLLTNGWLSRVLAHFAERPELGVLGGRQLDHNGALHSMGDLLFHPHGYQHIGAGAQGDCDATLIEPDHIMGCFHCLRREAFDAVGAYDETIGRGQTIDFGVRLRVAGWRALSDPAIVYEHRLALRHGRASRSDHASGMAEARRVFAEKWGFDRLCPDFDAMRKRLGDKLVARPTRVNALDDVGIGDGLHRGAELANRCALILGALQPGTPARVVTLGAGDGQLAMLLRAAGVVPAAVDDREEARTAALAARQLDPRREAPHVVADLASLPIDSDSIDLLLIDRALERHPNPIRLLQEVHRVLRSGATCLVLARWRTPEGQLIAPQVSDRFTPTSLRNLISTCGLFAPIPIARRPMPNDEPKVLFLALRALPMQSEVPVPIGNPTHCAGPIQ